MSRNNNYSTGNLLEYLYHQNCCKFIGIDFIDLSRQTIMNIPLQINFIGKLIMRGKWCNYMCVSLYVCVCVSVSVSVSVSVYKKQ